MEDDNKTFWERLSHHLNFFRVHLLLFTFTPIVAACILYAANGSASGNANSTDTGQQKVTFIDSLFVCFSAMSTTGLVTVNLSALHPFQQFVLYFLFIIGDYSFVSLIMVIVRKRYFRTHCEQLLLNDRLRRTNTINPKASIHGFTIAPESAPTVKKVKGQKLHISGPVDGHRIEDYVEDRSIQQVTDSPVDMTFERNGDGAASTASTLGRSSAALLQNGASLYRTDSPQVITTALPDPISSRARQFTARQRLRQQTRMATINIGELQHSRAQQPYNPPPQLPPIRLQSRPTATFHVPSDPEPVSHHIPHPIGHKHTGYGGFPTPLEILNQFIPQGAKQKFGKPVRRMALFTPSVYAASYQHGNEESWSEAIKGSVAKWMPEGLTGLVVGRNSRFWTEELEDEELEQIGGVEYRALKLLTYFVSSYIILWHAVPFAIISIYFSKIHHWDSAFQASSGVQSGTVDKTWFSLFLSSAAYTGSGMSLIDQGLAPFQTCYLVIYVLIVVMLAGNHALPVMLRFCIWLGTKIFRQGTIHETLHFLLEHPRRCFLYLFPSHQTWYLVVILIAFMVIELFSFLVLNIGLPVLDSLGGWERFSDGLLQSLSVRAAGFGIVSVSQMAPAVLFMYIIVMYIAIYPIAMSVRSTNVYEEQALGVYDHEDPETSSEDEPEFKGPKREVFSKYLLWHMRRQLAFDIWPLAVAVFMICIFERGKILDPTKDAWFTVFRILFECTSAYSTIGLTLGTPNNNFSFSGEFGTVSKIIMMVVMLRGRHRGLPVAIDRAILLPTEYARISKPADGLEKTTSRPTATRGETNRNKGQQVVKTG
ncbi:hypothetical protein CI109_102642 [Kwoniella shandongensis]|uniref:Uncharacterized protein n=1 Tax=Kwoniella shandongensis TaxID=1734106 RepID=A0A5M6BUC7_9TREE|nr:uncharacterized protein CI109_005223 [Kwoniella shandongensis]KAA5526454.1 hypothetical protein CI109_005223 [Kwoniella shandongensis]